MSARRLARDPEQRSEGIERVEAPVEAERELVEVGLQVLGADAVMDAVEPSLQVAEDEMEMGRNSSAISGSPHSAMAWWS